MRGQIYMLLGELSVAFKNNQGYMRHSTKMSLNWGVAKR